MGIFSVNLEKMMQKELFKKYTAMGVTDVGNIREHNEDTVLIDEALGLVLVADGMGGHQAGEVASMEASQVIQKLLQMHEPVGKKPSWMHRLLHKNEVTDFSEYLNQLEQALSEANNHIYQLNLEREFAQGTGMGTTVSGFWLVTPEIMLVFNIGDSRVYRLRENKLTMLTKDHSILQHWHDNGCLGEKPGSNIILRAIGPYPDVLPDIHLLEIESKDAFLICSDGLTDMVDDSVIESSLQGLSTEKLAVTCQTLLDLALAVGGKDNVSIVLMTQ